LQLAIEAHGPLGAGDVLEHARKGCLVAKILSVENGKRSPVELY
jgi:hypothetical protein